MKTHGWTRAFLLASLLAFTPISRALAQDAGATTGILIFPSFSVRQETGVIAGNQTVYHTDLRLGYVTPSGFYLGMLFENTRSSGAWAINQMSIGNTVGYFLGPVSLMTTYFLSAEHSEEGPTGQTTRIQGSGWQIDLAYRFPLAGNWLSLAPVLSYRAMKFKYSEHANQVINDTNSQTYLYPYIGLMFLF